MRVLFLATYFPKPANPLMGNWALAQARGLARQGVELRTVSFTSWVPSWAPRMAGRLSNGARAFASCPSCHRWEGGVTVEYPRWLVYQTGPMKRIGHRAPSAPMLLGWLSARRHLGALVRDWRPDIVYAHHSAINGYLAYKLAEENRLPYVVTDHSFADISECERFPARRRFLEPIANHAARMIGVSFRMEALLRETFPSAHTATVHNGTDPVPAPILERPRPPELEGRLVVLSVAFFYPRKGLSLLVRAFARVAGRHPSAVLRIAGDGPDREVVMAAVREARLGDRIQLLGRLPHEDVLQQLAWSDAFALLAWDEPFGVVFSEAAACGRPILLARDCGFGDFFRDGVHGFSVPPRNLDAAADRLDALLADETRRRAMGRAAFELWVTQLTWDSSVGRLADILRESASGPLAPHRNRTRAI